MAKIGEMLVQKGLITTEQLEAAIEKAKETGHVLGKVLIDLKMLSEAQLLNTLGVQLGLPFYPSLKKIDIGKNVIDSVPVKFVWHYKFMPVRLQGSILTIAVFDPMEIWSMEDLKLHLGFNIERVLATEEEIMAAIRKHYGFGADTVEQILSQAPQEENKENAVSEVDVDKDPENEQQASVINLVNDILSDAIISRATDIHFEPSRDKIRLRYRIDGILYDMHVSDQTKYLFNAIVSRIKILSNLDIVERRIPQDGRAIIKVRDQQVDLRISIIPSVYGEGVVIRILPINFIFDLQKLGFLNDDFKDMEKIMQKPHGIIFLTGPTGSGKTTTLYACLNKLNEDKIKIITIEDPVEYELGGIMQIQIKPEVGFTFASALRSILRHDPDMVMIGEVRDLETAELAIRTALTGHLIFSTLHTNDAASGAARLMDIGIAPYLVTSSVNAFISQRLVRKICPYCKEERTDKGGLPKEFLSIAVYYGKGCERCNFVGFRGRTTLYEIISIEPEIQELILEKVSAVKIRQKADELGFKSIKQVGMEKVCLGETTPEEVFRVVGI